MHEENFLSSWLREYEEGSDEVGSKRKRVAEKEEVGTVVEKEYVNPGTVEAFAMFNQGEMSECDRNS